MKKVFRTVIIVTITTSTFEVNCRLLLSLCLLDETNRIIAIAENPIWSVFMLKIKLNRLSNKDQAIAINKPFNHSSCGKTPVAILTGKSTRYLIGVQLIICKKFSGKSLIGIYCPDNTNIAKLYETTNERTSPNQKAKHTIIKYIQYDK